jgi:hypothetical protein
MNKNPTKIAMFTFVTATVWVITAVHYRQMNKLHAVALESYSAQIKSYSAQIGF